MTIERVETKRGHYYKIDGKRAIGVTTALNGIPKDALKYWAAREVATFAVDHIQQVRSMLDSGGRTPTISYLKEVPFQKRDDAAVRGTDVHAFAEKYQAGEQVEAPRRLWPYLEGFAQYINDFNPTPVHSELVVASYKHTYAGTLDSIEDIPNVGRALVDYKTSNDIFGEHALQVAGYRFADVYLDKDGAEQPMLPVEHTFILHIQPGGYDLIPVEADESVYELFLTALANYRQNVQSGRLKKLLGEPLKPKAVAA